MRSYLFAFLFLIGLTYGNTAKAGYDLTVSDISSSPPYVNFTIKNHGTTHFYGYQTLRVYSASTGAYRYFNYYVSLAPNGGTRGASYSLSELGAASSASQPTQSFTANADWDRQVYETNESNNSLTKSVSLATPRPDMIVDDIWAEGNYLKVRTKNVGTQMTSGYPQVSVTANGQNRTQQIYTSIAAGGSNTYNFPLSDFGLVSGQSYSINAMADSYNQMYESNESNNSLTKTVALAGNLADLIVTGVVEQGANIKFSFKNNGTAAINDPFYLDYGSNLSSSGQLFWSMAAGEVKDIVVPKSSLGQLNDGTTYQFWGRADSTSWITESNENNNYMAVDIRVGVENLPDLIIKPAVVDGSDVVFSFEVIANPSGDTVFPYNGYPLRLSMSFNGSGSSMTKDYASLVAGVYTERYPLSWFYLTPNANFTATSEIDSAKWVVEKLENNNLTTQTLCNGNCAPAPTPTPTPPPSSVDLQITNITRYLYSPYVYALVTYRNAGTSSSSSKFRIKTVINGMTVYNYSDLSVPNPGASAQTYIYIGTNIPSGTLTGTVDYLNSVVESNESNNIFIKSPF